MGFSQPLNQEGSNNGEEGKMRGKTGLSFLLATICLAKFWPKLLDEATLLAIHSPGCQQWTMAESGVGEGAGLCFSEARKAKLKVKEGNAVGGSCEQAAKGSCAREGV